VGSQRASTRQHPRTLVGRRGAFAGSPLLGTNPRKLWKKTTLTSPWLGLQSELANAGHSQCDKQNTPDIAKYNQRKRNATTVTTSDQHFQEHAGQSHGDITSTKLPRGEANVAPSKVVQPPERPTLLKRNGDRGWGTTVMWLSGLSLCVLVRTCFVGCGEVRPFLPTESTSQIVPTGPSAPTLAPTPTPTPSHQTESLTKPKATGVLDERVLLDHILQNVPSRVPWGSPTIIHPQTASGIGDDYHRPTLLLAC